MSYPLTGYHFNVEWGASRVVFSKVSGLEVSTEPVLYREGNSKSYAPMIMPGLLEYSHIVLERGMMPSDNEFFEWMSTINLDQVDRRDLTISLLNAQHEPVTVWRVRNAWPIRLRGPVLNASCSEVAIELLEIAHEGLNIATS